MTVTARAVSILPGIQFQLGTEAGSVQNFGGRVRGATSW